MRRGRRKILQANFFIHSFARHEHCLRSACPKFDCESGSASVDVCASSAAEIIQTLFDRRRWDEDWSTLDIGNLKVSRFDCSGSTLSARLVWVACVFAP